MVGGFLSVIVGLATIAAAVWAGKWAKAAAQHTQTGVAEAKRGADAAENSITEARRIGEAQVKCYLTIDAAELVFDYGWQPYIITTITNSGQSPALEVFASFDCEVTTFPTVFTQRVKRFSVYKDKRMVGASSKEDVKVWYGMPIFHPNDSSTISGTNRPVRSISVSVKLIVTARDIFDGQTSVVDYFHGNVNEFDHRARGATIPLERSRFYGPEREQP